MNVSTFLITSVYFVLIGDRGQIFFFFENKKMASVKNIAQWVVDMILFNHILRLNNKIMKLNKNYKS